MRSARPMNLEVRLLEPCDYPLLKEFLYHAIFLPQGVSPLPRDIIYDPRIFVYIDGFGGKDDLGLVAEQDGQAVGAAWARIIPAYGHIDDATPELAMSVLPECRGKGVGTQLLVRALDLLREGGFGRVSLSVQKDNPAQRLYRRFGFQVVSESAEDFLMVKEFPPETMEAFFDDRAETYDRHMAIDMGLSDFYEAVASLVTPVKPAFRLLDLGCGTGLELELLFERFPGMQVTGIDLSRKMLDKLCEKFPGRPIELVHGSFLDVGFASGFDIVLSTYSLHHFDAETKRGLYQRIREALAPGGMFLLGDYTASSPEQQELSAQSAAHLRQANGLPASENYHIDIPLAAQTEMGLMKAAGFEHIELARQWSQASIITARN